jgi:molybdenum cofactor cytidylyltransferase
MAAKPTFSLGAIILAAGSSSRMGSPKLLLPWEQTTILGHLIRVWSELPATQIAVVHAAADTLMETELARLQFPIDQRIVNPEPDRGMFSSIQCAARWTGWATDVMHGAVILGDQPHLKRETLRKLVAFAGEYPENVCQPGRRGRPRHPVLLPRKIFEPLTSSNATTLKEFLQSQSTQIKVIELDDAGLDLDLDYRADYEKALRMVSGK